MNRKQIIVASLVTLILGFGLSQLLSAPTGNTASQSPNTGTRKSSYKLKYYVEDAVLPTRNMRPSLTFMGIISNDTIVIDWAGPGTGYTAHAWFYPAKFPIEVEKSGWVFIIEEFGHDEKGCYIIAWAKES